LAGRTFPKYLFNAIYDQKLSKSPQSKTETSFQGNIREVEASFQANIFNPMVVYSSWFIYSLELYFLSIY
jgi:hypothetical protein